jgi:hypothetical protein
MHKVLSTPPAVTLAAQTGNDPLTLLIIDNEAHTLDGGPPVTVLAPLNSAPKQVDAHSCFSVGVIEISGPSGTAQAIAGMLEGVDPWGQVRSISVPLIDVSMLQQADPNLLPPLDLGLKEPQQWWADLLTAFTEIESGACLQKCWECDAVCGEDVGGVACLSASPCPDDNWADSRYHALQQRYAAARDEAFNVFLHQALLIAIGVAGCVASVFGLACVGAAITKAGQALTPVLLGPVSGAAASGGAASVGGAIGLSAIGVLGILAFVAGTGGLSLALGAAAIMACIAASLAALEYANAAYLAALEKAKAELSADLASLLGDMCNCNQAGYSPPPLSCLGQHGTGGLGPRGGTSP